MNEQRVALVTGASRGIGRGIARRLAQLGISVLVNHRDSAEAAESLVRQIGDEGGLAETMQADVTDLTMVRTMIGAIEAKYGRLDVLVNNAGRSEDGFLLLTSDEQWWSVFNDNLLPVVNCTRAALPLLMRKKGGAIINISSISGLIGVEGQTAYSAAKSAIVGFTKALARELGPKGISINCIAPGPIDTEMYRKVNEAKQKARMEMLPLRRLGKVEEVAEVVALLADGKAGFLHGQVIAIDGGATI